MAVFHFEKKYVFESFLGTFFASFWSPGRSKTPPKKTHASGTPKKEAKIDFLTKSCRKGSKMGYPMLVHFSGLGLQKEGLKKRGPKMGPRLTFGCHLGAIWTHFGRKFVVRWWKNGAERRQNDGHVSDLPTDMPRCFGCC